MAWERLLQPFLRYQRPPFHFRAYVGRTINLSHIGSRDFHQNFLVCSQTILTYLLKIHFQFDGKTQPKVIITTEDLNAAFYWQPGLGDGVYLFSRLLRAFDSALSVPVVAISRAELRGLRYRQACISHSSFRTPSSSAMPGRRSTQLSYPEFFYGPFS